MKKNVSISFLVTIIVIVLHFLHLFIPISSIVYSGMIKCIHYNSTKRQNSIQIVECNSQQVAAGIGFWRPIVQKLISDSCAGIIMTFIPSSDTSAFESFAKTYNLTTFSITGNNTFSSYSALTSPLNRFTFDANHYVQKNGSVMSNVISKAAPSGYNGIHSFAVNYVNTPKRLSTIYLESLLEDNLPQGFFKASYVLLGQTKDRTIPFAVSPYESSRCISKLELLANAAYTFFVGPSLRYIHTSLLIVLLFFGSLLVCFLFRRYQIIHSIIITAGITFLSVIISFMLLKYYVVYIPITEFLAMIVLTCVLFLFYRQISIDRFIVHCANPDRFGLIIRPATDKPLQKIELLLKKNDVIDKAILIRLNHRTPEYKTLLAIRCSSYEFSDIIHQCISVVSPGKSSVAIQEGTFPEIMPYKSKLYSMVLGSGIQAKGLLVFSIKNNSTGAIASGDTLSYLNSFKPFLEKQFTRYLNEIERRPFHRITSEDWSVSRCRTIESIINYGAHGDRIFLHTLNTVSCGIICVDTKGEILYINESLFRITGIRNDNEFPWINIMEIMHCFRNFRPEKYVNTIDCLLSDNTHSVIPMILEKDENTFKFSIARIMFTKYVRNNTSVFLIEVLPHSVYQTKDHVYTNKPATADMAKTIPTTLLMATTVSTSHPVPTIFENNDQVDTFND